MGLMLKKRGRLTALSVSFGILVVVMKTGIFEILRIEDNSSGTEFALVRKPLDDGDVLLLDHAA